ncbi:glycosyltransferase [Neomicrococcus aestuarii]|uniref:D-inositol 3-phosphate glycosyltransferase n=1 Tax=Neomicrococcus aestuarii TaxID=556325 RepID=A0A1L2ZMU4_9MICC|nr:glycosyltransferase [Neomicrococcus aestuarii]APF40459.1 glycosyl transferase family 1 [Neomicrococcus aestuarii]
MKIAIAHDYLTQRGGAERVVLSLHKAYPEATIYTTLYNPDSTFPEFKDADIVASPLNKIRFFRKDHRTALPFLAPVSSRVKIDADIILTSSSGWAHGFDATGTQIVYCHTPARWLYLAEDYLGSNTGFSPKRLALSVLAPLLTRWDQNAARSAKNYLANSTVVRNRIREVYGIEAPIVYPPHSLDVEGAREDFLALDAFKGTPYLLVVARLMKYKNVDQVIHAANELNACLLIVGDGPEKAELERIAGPSVRIVSGLSDAQLRAAYSGASVLIAASYEDFGITPLEAAAWGIPTLALRGGGYLDTVLEGTTGLFFDRAISNQIVDVIRNSKHIHWDSAAIKKHAESFSEARFHREIREHVNRFTTDH